MGVLTKVQPIDEDVSILINEALSPAARSAAFASFARDKLAEGEQIDEAILGHIPAHKVFVDGVEGGSEDNVRPDGVIVYEFELLSDIFAWIADQLKQHAPVLTGRFRDSIKFFADGIETDVAGEIPQASQFVFLSSVAYARKIEGSPGRKPESSQSPNGVFEAVAALANQRYSNQARIGFAYISPSDGGIVDWAKSTVAKRHSGSPARRAEWLSRVPAIVITLRS